ncbi:MbcA/ParS/Xre antitoxin family protein [Cognatishimia sp. WU-CL00825]|uniref:MbcA/ParS/Xre antitoxin family protein n=1 Tax=Cognatishimia sp. WU-CL00825 TaxID=3127658 RepID=UPI00310587AD
MVQTVTLMQDTSHDPGRLVAKAVINAGAALGLSQAEIAQIIGVSPSQISKFKSGSATLVDKPYELALYLIRVFRSLDAITGGDAETNRTWMRNDNTDLRGSPADLAKSVAGLVNVMAYLDAQRAPL